MDHDVVMPEAPSELRARVDIDAILAEGARAAAEVEARWHQERLEGVLELDPLGPKLKLASAATNTPAIVDVVFELGRHRYTFTAGVRWVAGRDIQLHPPEVIVRADRRRFPRIHHPDSHRNGIRLVEGEHDLPVLDLSPNGASFVIPGIVVEGSRMPVEVVIDGHAAAMVDFEVIRARPDPMGRGSVVSGRFLQPTQRPEEQVDPMEALALLREALDANPADIVENVLEKLKTPDPADRRDPGGPT